MEQFLKQLIHFDGGHRFSLTLILLKFSFIVAFKYFFFLCVVASNLTRQFFGLSMGAQFTMPKNELIIYCRHLNPYHSNKMCSMSLTASQWYRLTLLNINDVFAIYWNHYKWSFQNATRHYHDGWAYWEGIASSPRKKITFSSCWSWNSSQKGE